MDRPPLDRVRCQLARLEKRKRDDGNLDDDEYAKRKKEVMTGVQPLDQLRIREEQDAGMDKFISDHYVEDNTTYEDVEAATALAEYSPSGRVSPAAISVVRQMDRTRRVIPHQKEADVDDAMKVVLQRGTFFTSYQAGTASRHHRHLALKRVLSDTHPAYRLANRVKTNDMAFTVVTTQPIRAGTLLGYLGGRIITGGEWEDYVSTQHDEYEVVCGSQSLGPFDMEGPFVSRGGPVPDSDKEYASNHGLVLDTSRSTNLFSCMRDCRGEPFSEGLSPGDVEPNVVLVEVFSEDRPRMAVVAAKSLSANQELAVDLSDQHWVDCKRALTRARHIESMNTLVNTHLDKIKCLEDDANPLIVEHKRHKSEIASLRAMAVGLAAMWQKKEGSTGELIPLHTPGTLDALIIEQHVGLDDAAAVGRLVSRLQSLVFDDGFRPKKPMEVDDGSCVWVDNETSEEYLAVQRKHGVEVANEVGRAWLEMQHYHDLSAGTSRVPWNMKLRRPMSISEILTLVACRCLKQGSTDDDSDSEPSDDLDDYDLDDLFPDEETKIVEKTWAAYRELTKKLAMPKANPIGC